MKLVINSQALILTRFDSMKSISSSEGTYVEAGKKMAKGSHKVSSSKTPVRLPSLIIMLLTSLHKLLCLVSHAVVMKELRAGREKLKASFLIAKERNSKQVYFKIILIQREVHDYTLFVHLNHEIALERNVLNALLKSYSVQRQCRVVT